MDGRYWLRLECRALARALRESGAQRSTAVRDALAFRQARRMLYQGSAEKGVLLESSGSVRRVPAPVRAGWPVMRRAASPPLSNARFRTLADWRDRSR